MLFSPASCPFRENVSSDQAQSISPPKTSNMGEQSKVGKAIRAAQKQLDAGTRIAPGLSRVSSGSAGSRSIQCKEVASDYFATIGSRQISHETDVSRTLMRREPRAHMVLNLSGEILGR